MLRHRWIFWATLFVVQMTFSLVRSYPNGAPESTCGSMMPSHGGALAQSNSTNKYQIKLSSTEVPAGGQITVSIVKSSASDPSFRGFLIRASPVGSTDATALGQISSFDAANAKYLGCFGQSQATLTHPSKSPKNNLTFVWTAPPYGEKVIFLATVVQEFSTFWVKFQSPVINVIEVEGSNQASPTLYSSPTLTPKSGSSDQSAAVITQAPLMDFDYSVCGETQSCFGFPLNCIEEQNCRMIVSYSAVGDRLSANIVGYTPGYVAFGLSTDQQMGDDSVIECMIPGTVAASVNQGNQNFKAVTNTSYFTVESTSYSSGTLKCHVTRPIITSVSPTDTNEAGVATDLNAAQYYLMLAMGNVNAERNDIEPHASDNAGVSSTMVDLMSAEYIIVGGNNKAAIEVVIHGSLMVIAWIGTVSIAIFMARYYKDMWPETTWCAVKVWFAVHRTLNMLTVLLTIAAFVLIFVYKKGFSSIWVENPHPILGCITMGLAVIQPFGALFRCAPGSAKRPIFNWFHFLVGNITYIVAVVTIFFAVNLSGAHLPTYFWWILIAYIGFDVIVFLVMECLGYVHHRKSEQEIIPMRDYNGHEGSLSSSMHHPEKHSSSKFKHVMLFLFIFGVCGFTAALVAVICT